LDSGAKNFLRLWNWVNFVPIFLKLKIGRGTIAQGSNEVDARAEESTRETEEKLDGRSKEGHEREEPARRAVGR
jgi:hypothetical protein